MSFSATPSETNNNTIFHRTQTSRSFFCVKTINVEQQQGEKEGPLSGIIRNTDIFKTCVTRAISQSKTAREMNGVFEIFLPFLLNLFLSPIRHQSLCAFFLPAESISTLPPLPLNFSCISSSARLSKFTDHFGIRASLVGIFEISILPSFLQNPVKESRINCPFACQKASSE